MGSDLQFHDAANIFPLLNGDDFDGLVEDLRQHGLRESIKTFEGKILDGRNRYRASLLAGCKVRYEEVETNNPVEYVVSLNIHRRHLTPSQLSMCAARAKEEIKKQAKDRQRGGPGGVLLPANLREASKGEASEIAGKLFGVGTRSVDFASKVIEKGVPELVQAVDEGRMAVSTAAIWASEPPEVQVAVATEPKRNRVYEKGNGKPKAKEKVGKPEIKHEVSDAMEFAQMAILQLQRIRRDDPEKERAFIKVEMWISKERVRDGN
jgi:ParB-like chromosome segregation protein Spo0J